MKKNYLVKVPSNQINKSIRRYTSIANQTHNLGNEINPGFLTGFSDAESNFTVRIIKCSTVKIGWTVQLCFQICLHKKDKDLLKKIQSYWGVGAIYDKKEACNYMVQSLQGLRVILDHFNRFPLLTKKRADFELFAQIFNLIDQKEHLTLPGIVKILSIKASMNLGLPLLLKTAFPDITPIERPKVESILISDPYWVAGFTAVLLTNWERNMCFICL